jgi:hypothetical protein
MVLLAMALAACAASDDSKPLTFTDDRGVSNQPFPNNYRAELLAFLKTYLNNPGCATSSVSGSAHANPTAATASRANGPFCSSTAGSTASSRTPVSPAPASSMRRLPSWRN